MVALHHTNNTVFHKEDVRVFSQLCLKHFKDGSSMGSASHPALLGGQVVTQSWREGMGVQPVPGAPQQARTLQRMLQRIRARANTVTMRAHTGAVSAHQHIQSCWVWPLGFALW